MAPSRRLPAAHRLVLAAVLAGLPAVPALGQEGDDLSQLSLEQLAEVEVTSVSRWPERLGGAANAVFVLTQEDIRRSGATTLVDLLRLVPGVHVAQLESGKWAVGVRGFTSRLARSTLVLIDGRSVYNPLFAGTYWELQDYVLADVDRIEVIRGPGGTLWGANAVNGVINIVTKAASATQGGYVIGRAGTWQRSVSMRYGGQAAEHGFWRAYAKAFDRDAAVPAVPPPYDAWQAGQAGVRGDFSLDARHHLTVQGDAYQGDYGTRVAVSSFDPPSSTTVDDDSRASGGNLLARLTRETSHGHTTIQSWIDRTRRLDPNFSEWRTTADIEASHHRRDLPLGQELIVGAGYRFTDDRTEAPATTLFEPPSRDSSLYSVFVQDEIPLLEGRVRVSGGVKVEHNAFTGMEWQPSLRGSWSPASHRLLWAAASRAIRSPSRIELDIEAAIFTAPTPPTFLRLLGNEDFQSETLVAWEIGWRDQSHARFFYDVSLFRNDHDRLLSLEPGTPFQETDPAPAHVIVPLTIANGLEGTGQGGELSGTWQPTRGFRLQGSWSYLSLDLRAKPGSADTTSAAQEDNSPKHQVALRTSFDFAHALELDAQLRWIDRLPNQRVDAYTELDAQLAWSPSADFRLALVGRNLLHDRHAEFGAPATRVEIERSVYGSVTWEF